MTAKPGEDYGVDATGVVVRDGAFTLPTEAAHVIAGLPYAAEITTLDMGPQGFDPGSRNRAPVTTTVGFYHSRDARYSCEGSAEGRVDFSDADGRTTTLKTVSKTFIVPPDPAGSLSSRLTLRSNTPAPWCVTRADMVIGLAESHSNRRKSVVQAQEAAAEDSQYTTDPIGYRDSIAPIVRNAADRNPTAPTEVYLSVEHLDALIPDVTERKRFLDIIDGHDEYCLSWETGADMLILLHCYVAGTAGHPKRAEFNKYIKVDPDGRTVHG